MPRTIRGVARTVIVSSTEIANFNLKWPCSNLDVTSEYYFEFARNGDLVDTDAPDCEAASAMADDCKAYWFEEIEPQWAD